THPYPLSLHDALPICFAPTPAAGPWIQRLAGPMTRGYARPRAPLHPTKAPPAPTRGVVPVSRAGAVHHPPSGPDPGDGDPRDGGHADGSEVTAAIEAALTTYLRSRSADADAIDPVFGEATEALADFVLGGGKRIRPTFAWWGWRGAGGLVEAPEALAVLRAISALELIQA